MLININKMIRFHLPKIFLVEILIELPRQLHASLSVKLQARTSSPMAQRDALWHSSCVSCSMARLLFAVYYWFTFEHLTKFLLYVFACNRWVQLKPKHSVRMHRRLPLKKAGGKIVTILRWCTVARARAIAFDASMSRQAPLATMQKKRASIFVCRHDVALMLIFMIVDHMRANSCRLLVRRS